MDINFWTQTLAILVLASFIGPANAKAPRDMVLQRSGEPSSTLLSLPDGANLIDCDKKPLSNFYCLRADASRETDILSGLSLSIERQGWTLLGSTSDQRPYTYIFTRPQTGVDCPLLIMITSADRTQKPRPTLPAGMIEIQIAQTVDARCYF